ncbi:hypothetical protein J0X19_22280 [Hymenobacter sp. BT186]|uniref:Uncharacterized protein n=1 Tax=Hymenobacter telluris TaxID=2816474 RepID=A0A939F053_9BACT|nr:hypothetical protein [Hymenobacter telluris]MBO0360705.1 hypothetical protein [Hymenobacter telluris]MBW3376732.1 hypothetical protein [Hymenobacter norwichensis]
MKITTLLTVALCSVTVTALAQNEEGIKLDVLRAPVSPASNLLGIATTDIDKPTDVSAFMLSLQSASSSFAKLPSNYAVDISPYYLFTKKRGDFTTNGLQSTKYEDIFKQTFIISAAIRNPDEAETNLNVNNTYAGLGLKFSILRGEYDDTTKTKLDKIIGLQKKMTDDLAKTVREWITRNDPEYAALVVQRQQLFTNRTGLTPQQVINSDQYKSLERQISEKLQNFTDQQTAQVRQEIFAEIKQTAATFQTSRVGLSWDINGGVSGEFIDKRFNRSRVYNAGVWTNFGYTTKDGIALLALARYLHNPNQIFALDNQPNKIGNINTLDGGLRLAYSRPQSKFSASAEGIYRSVLSSNTIDPSWRMVFNADYAIFQNQKLTFSFGRNFDGTVSKDGNLIAALTFLAGFGNNR